MVRNLITVVLTFFRVRLMRVSYIVLPSRSHGPIYEFDKKNFRWPSLSVSVCVHAFTSFIVKISCIKIITLIFRSVIFWQTDRQTDRACMPIMLLLTMGGCLWWTESHVPWPCRVRERAPYWNCCWYSEMQLANDVACVMWQCGWCDDGRCLSSIIYDHYHPLQPVQCIVLNGVISVGPPYMREFGA